MHMYYENVYYAAYKGEDSHEGGGWLSFPGDVSAFMTSILMTGGYGVVVNAHPMHLVLKYCDIQHHDHSDG